MAGIGWAILAVMTASALLAVPKLVGGEVSAIQITLLRYLAGFFTIAPFFLWDFAGNPQDTPDRFSPQTFILHVLRAFLAVLRISCFFYAVTHMPFANAQAITLTNGVFMIVFAALVLRERVRPVTIVVSAVCLAGGVVAAEPDWQTGGFVSYGALSALCGAAIWGVESTIIKYTSSRDHTVRIIFTVNLIALMLIVIPGVIAWKHLGAGQLLPLLLTGPLAILTQVFNVKAFRASDANLLAPFRYISVIFAISIGWFVFGEWPTLAGGIGMAIILVSGVVLTINLGGYPRRLA